MADEYAAFRGQMTMPTLIDSLKKILDQYPDDGQILKEIIQNAEDAEATKVVFLIDNKTYGRNLKKLFSEGLAEYQGPALYAYNDAVFQTKDWDGIGRLWSSNKADDPLQVGRFGLGFKSVFHLTDLPGIFSGEMVGFLDPHEKHFHATANKKTIHHSIYTWNLKNTTHRNEILKLSDQFSPFKQSLFNVDDATFKKGYFKGTMFRFPLRKQPSELSEKCYHKRDLEQLFYSLQKESHLLLLFLKKIEGIQCYKQNSNGTFEKLIDISIADNIKSIAKNKRQELLTHLRSSLNTAFSTSYPLSFNVHIGVNQESSDWIVTQYYDGQKGDFKDKNYLPLVGIATKIDMNVSVPYGQVFCFLPLPLEKDSPTGFKFHVHASFAVEQNRRHIKYISADQNADKVTDKDLLWNKFLLTAIFPQCLKNLIKFLIDWHGNNNEIELSFLEKYRNDILDKEMFAQFVYSLMPNSANVNVQWRCLMESFFKDCFNHIKFYSHYSLKWLDKSQTWFINPKDDIDHKILISIFGADKKEVSLTPQHIIDQIFIHSNGAYMLNSQHICSTYKMHQFLLNFDESYKIALLKYFSLNAYSITLIGTNLLPLMDATWINFETKSSCNKIFISNGKYDDKNLFPMLNQKFVNLNKMPQNLLRYALSSAQVERMNENDFSDLIRIVLSHMSGQKTASLNNPKWFTMNWLKIVWKHIREDYPNDLTKFEGLHLLPIDDNNVIQLYKNKCILQNQDNNFRFRYVEFICQRLNLIYIKNLQNYIYSHVSLINEYTLRPCFLSILVLILNKNNMNKIVTKFNSFSNEERKQIVYGIAQEVANVPLSGNIISLLRKLPIFPTKENCNKQPMSYVSLENTNKACQTKIDISLPSYGNLLNVDDAYICTLANKLQVQFLNNTTLIDEFYLSPIIKRINFYNVEESQKLLQFLCKNPLYISANSKQFLKSHKFITKTNGQLASPSELFDPSDNKLHLLLDDHYFPSGEWAKNEYMNTLKQLGLKIKLNFEIEDWVSILNKIKFKFKEHPLDKRHMDIAIQILLIVSELVEDCDKLDNSLSNLYIPNEQNVLVLSTKLLFNNLTWHKSNNSLYCHPRISKDMAGKLRLKTLTENIMTLNKISMPFGQQENLIDRLNTILTSYCLKEDILKEMLQNADDSGASEVHFILDRRQHGDKKIFDSSWKSQQGPALCIYNNKSFTKQDLEGIQKLGRGSKRDDVMKTGHFGVGFNSVYQITDVPSFITTINDEIDGGYDSEKLGTVVGIFDPNCSFLPDANSENSGGLFKKDLMADVFTDVYSGYLQDFEKYDVSQCGTVFRLPLRNQESKNKSQLKQDVINIDDIVKIFNKFREKINDSLIFLKSIKLLSLVIIDDNNKQEIFYSVKSSSSEKTVEKKCNFMKFVRKQANKLFKGNIQLQEIQCRELIYDVQLNDHHFNETKWIVVRRFGFEDNQVISQKLRTQYSNRNIPLLPFGGVAFPDNEMKIDPHFSSKIFNLLPLPLDVKLPCHIDGNFVMSNEGRRGFVNETSENPTYKSEWNELILSQIIVPAYCSLLIHFQAKLSSLKTRNDFLNKRNEVYYKMFPCSKDSIDDSEDNVPPQIKYLKKHFYNYIHENKKPLFLEYNFKRELPKISWIHSGLDESIFFDHWEDAALNIFKGNECAINTVKCILIKLDMKLISCPFEVIKYFQDYKVKIKVISPKCISEHIMSIDYLEGRKTLIEKTVFGNVPNLVNFLNYLTYDDQTIVINLPVLLSADGYVIKASPENSLYTSRYATMFPHKIDKFIESRVEKFFIFYKIKLHSEVPAKKRKLDNIIVKNITIREFANFLNDFEPVQKFLGKKCRELEFKDALSRYVNPDQWFSSIWSFLESLYSTKNLTFLNEIGDFCLLPVEKRTPEKTNWFYPISKRLCVINEDDMSNNLCCTLYNIGVPTLRTLRICTEASKRFLQNIIGDVSDPEHVLNALEDFFGDGATIADKFDSLEILKYFNEKIKVPQMKQIKFKLTELPIFHDIKGRICSLNNCPIVVVPKEIPEFPIEKPPLNKKIYLSENNSLTDLYKYLTDTNEINSETFYTDVIFPHFNLFDRSEKLTHLKFIKDSLVYSDSLLANGLKELCFLQSPSGILLKTSNFYSKREKLFTLMEINFPSSPYDGDEWHDFLKNCGLNIKVTSEKFINYARQVQFLETKKGGLVSTRLLICLEKNLKCYINDQFLNTISNIPFIIPSDIDKDYLDICNISSIDTYISISTSKLYSSMKFYWTVSGILPAAFDGHLLELSEKFKLTKFSISDMIAHMKNVYKSINGNKILFSKKSFSDKTVELTCDYIEHLSKSDLNDVTLKDLSNLPIIFVNSEDPFVKPGQCAIDITEDDALPPYIFKLPLKYGKYTQFLMKLGATNRITIEQCLKPLKILKMKYGDTKLKPDDHNYANKIFDRFIILLTPSSSAAIEKLYIPCRSDKLESSELVVCLDNSTLSLNALPDHVPLLQHKSYENLMFLTYNIRPKLYSEIVREKLLNKGETRNKSNSVKNIENRLANFDFRNGFARILTKAIANKNESQEKINKMFENMNNILLECVDFIEIITLWGDKILDETRREVNFYAESTFENGIKIFVTYSSSDVAKDLSRYLIDLYFRDTTNEKLMLEKILTCDSKKINQLLDENTYAPLNVIYSKYRLGVEIPLEDHFTLVQDVFRFFQKQLVAYEEKDSFDDGEDADPKYILVEIVSIVGDDPPNLSSKYEVNFGQYTKIVSAVYLHSFAMVDNANSTSVILMNPSETSEQSPPVIKVFGTLKEIINDLKILLKEIWGLEDATMRKKAIKRLFLRWHPDKNPNNVQLCTEVFKHLQILIEMLESGKSIDDYNETDSNSSNNNSCSRTSSYYNDDYFERMNRRARQHNRSYQEDHGNTNFHSSGNYNYRYHNFHSSVNYNSRYHNFFSKFNHIPTKKPQEARIFLDQANNDFNVANNDANNAHQWMCIKYYTAAQNSLKAAHCAKNSSNLPSNFSSLSSLSKNLNCPDISKLCQKLDSLLGDLTQLTTPESMETVYRRIDQKISDSAREIARNICLKCSNIVESNR